MFKVSNLCKIYHHKEVVNNFSYEFDKGIYLLLGTNGSGKSTLLKMFAGLVRPSNKDYKISKTKISYMCERIELSNEKPFNYLKKISKMNNISADIKELLNKWNVPNKNGLSLSKGNKQKVAILMTYLLDTEVYLFDEPTDALDQNSIKLFKEYIMFLESLKKTIIIATHEKKYFNKLNYKVVKICS